MDEKRLKWHQKNDWQLRLRIKASLMKDFTGSSKEEVQQVHEDLSREMQFMDVRQLISTYQDRYKFSERDLLRAKEFDEAAPIEPVHLMKPRKVEFFSKQKGRHSKQIQPDQTPFKVLGSHPIEKNQFTSQPAFGVTVTPDDSMLAQSPVFAQSKSAQRKLITQLPNTSVIQQPLQSPVVQKLQAKPDKVINALQPLNIQQTSTVSLLTQQERLAAQITMLKQEYKYHYEICQHLEDLIINNQTQLTELL